MNLTPSTPHKAFHGAPATYSSCFSAVAEEMQSLERTVAQERVVAEELVSELMQMASVRRSLLARNSSRFQTISVCLALLKRSHQLGFESPQEAQEVAELAAGLAERLDLSSHIAECVHDVRARCWAQVGNARRIQSNVAGAEEAFTRAGRELKLGSGDPLEAAFVLGLLSNLRRLQNRLADCKNCLDAALNLYREAGDGHMEGRTLIKLSAVHQAEGDSASTMDTLRQGLGLIDLDLEPYLVVTSSHLLATALADAGHFNAAHQALQRERQALERLEGFHSTHLRLRWLEGIIESGLCRWNQAERAFKLARVGFERLGATVEVGLVSMDLALLLARQQRTAELKALVSGLVPIFESLQLHDDAMAALLLFREAVETENATLGLVQEIRTCLEESQATPGQRPQRATPPAS